MYHSLLFFTGPVLGFSDSGIGVPVELGRTAHFTVTL